MPMSFSSQFLLYEQKNISPCLAFCRGALFIYFRKRALEIKVFLLLHPSVPPPAEAFGHLYVTMYTVYMQTQIHICSLFICSLGSFARSFLAESSFGACLGVWSKLFKVSTPAPTPTQPTAYRPVTPLKNVLGVSALRKMIPSL